MQGNQCCGKTPWSSQSHGAAISFPFSNTTRSKLTFPGPMGWHKHAQDEACMPVEWLGDHISTMPLEQRVRIRVRIPLGPLQHCANCDSIHYRRCLSVRAAPWAPEAASMRGRCRAHSPCQAQEKKEMSWELTFQQVGKTVLFGAGYRHCIGRVQVGSPLYSQGWPEMDMDAWGSSIRAMTLARKEAAADIDEA